MSEAPQSVAVLSSASVGGAGIAARRLADALTGRAGLTVDFIDLARFGEAVPAGIVPPRSLTNRRISDVHFTVEYPGFARGWVIETLKSYDVVNVHWAVTLVALGELDALSRAGRPLVFWLHDFLHVSGGCHYPGPCTQLSDDCLVCPQLDTAAASARLPAIARRIKAEIFARPNVHLVAPSAYVRDGAVASGIVPAARAHVLRNPYEAPHAPRRRDGTGAARILLIADNLGERRKNMRLALAALTRLAAEGAPRPFAVDLIGEGSAEVEAILRAAAIPFHAHGRVHDHRRVSAICHDCDIVLTASLEDNWPNVLVEAGVYGVLPVVGPGHGCAEFVRAFDYGEIAFAYTEDAFALALGQALASLSPARADAAGAAIRAAHAPAPIARQFAERFLPAARAPRHVAAAG
ncbi:MAG: hypothetical protein AcusKO_51040 [Acuticoccus sp.]